MFRPAHTPAVDLWAYGMQQPRPESWRSQYRSLQTHGSLPSPSAAGMVKLMATPLQACSTKRSLVSVVRARMVVGSPYAHHQLATMGRHWSVIVHAIAHALQRPGATHDRDS